MTLAILTTPVARYTVPEHLLKHWRMRVLADQTNTLRLEVWNALGERIQDFGNICVAAPAIWTHVPVPLGFPIEAIHAQFEIRTAVVLGEWFNVPNLSKYDGTMQGAEFNDNRYVSMCMRGNWMMYLDLAISQRQ